MIHQYKLNGYNIILDVNSGSVHSVDEVAYDIIGMYENTDKEELITKILDKYRNAIQGIKSQNFEPTPCKISCEYCPYKNALCNLNK